MLERKVVTQKVVFFLPGAMKTLTRFSPTVMQGFAIEFWLNRLFSDSIRRGELAFLKNKTIRIRVVDIALDFSLRLINHRLRVHLPALEEDVFFKAGFGDLLSLVCGKSDPDTLFFRRRLMVSGDTELGLALKNFLDRLNPEEFLPRHLYRWLDRLAEGFAAQPAAAAPQ